MGVFSKNDNRLDNLTLKYAKNGTKQENFMEKKIGRNKFIKYKRPFTRWILQKCTDLPKANNYETKYDS